MRATMQAAVLADVGTLGLEGRPLPVITRPDDVLLDVECCGICGTDLKILSVPPGHPASVGVVLGHEIVGAGRIGWMFVALLEAAGATVLAMEPAELRAELARAMGASRVVDPRVSDPVEATLDLTDGLGADVVVDAVGSQLSQALGL